MTESVTPAIAKLRAIHEANGGAVAWCGRTFPEGVGGVWLPSTAALFTCPNVEEGVLEAVAAEHNAFSALLNIAEAAANIRFWCGEATPRRIPLEPDTDGGRAAQWVNEPCGTCADCRLATALAALNEVVQ